MNISDLERMWRFECAEADRKPYTQDGMAILRCDLHDGFTMFATDRNGVLWGAFVHLYDANNSEGACRHAMRNPFPLREA